VYFDVDFVRGKRSALDTAQAQRSLLDYILYSASRRFSQPSPWPRHLHIIS